MTHVVRFRHLVKTQRLWQKFTSDVDNHWRNQQCITVGPLDISGWATVNRWCTANVFQTAIIATAFITLFRYISVQPCSLLKYTICYYIYGINAIYLSHPMMTITQSNPVLFSLVKIAWYGWSDVHFETSVVMWMSGTRTNLVRLNPSW